MKLQDVRALVFQRESLATSCAATVFLVPHTLTQAEQGLFFTFLSLAAIQSIFEADVTIAIVDDVGLHRPTLAEDRQCSNSDWQRSAVQRAQLVNISPQFSVQCF